MPVPASINDLSTSAGSNSPAGTETPSEGDNYIRTYGSFIAALRDLLNGVSASTVTVQNLSVATTTSTGYIDKPNSAAVSAYRVTSTQSLPASTVTTVLFNAESADRSSSYDTTTGIFTAPRTGLYRASAMVTVQNNSVSNVTYNGAYLTKNNSTAAGDYVNLAGPVVSGTNLGPAGNSFDSAASSIFSLTSGDTIRVRVNVGAGAALALNTSSTLSVDYLG